MQELQNIVNNKVQSMVDENIIQKAIEEGVQNAIDKAIANQFQSYGTITKQIEKAIETGLSIDTKELPFETYNQQMLVAVKQKMGNFFAESASNKFMAEMDKVLAPAPEKMDIKELVQAIVKIWKTDEPWDADDLDEEASVELQEPDWSSDGKSFNLEMWKQKESSGYRGTNRRADINLFINDGKISISHRHSYNPTCFDEAEALIFKAYAAGTTITGLNEFDAYDCDLTLKESKY